MSKLKAIIIDDEPLARGIIRNYLKAFPDIEIAGECNDGFEGVKAIGENHPDLVFLDIQMPKISGFEMLELIDDPAPAIIFTTAFDEYAVKAFEAHAVDYLLKPFSAARFAAAVQKMITRQKSGQKDSLQTMIEETHHPEEHNRVVVKAGNAIKIIPVGDIHYVEAFDDYVKIHTAEKFFMKKKTMAYFEEMLDAADFLRVHRSFIVNLKELTRIEPMEKDSHIIFLRSGARVPVSKSGYSRLKEVLNI